MVSLPGGDLRGRPRKNRIRSPRAAAELCAAIRTRNCGHYLFGIAHAVAFVIALPWQPFPWPCRSAAAGMVWAYILVALLYFAVADFSMWTVAAYVFLTEFPQSFSHRPSALSWQSIV